MRIAIIDDEINEIKALTQICKNYAMSCSADISICPFKDGREFLKSSKEQYYTLAFIDIYMDTVDGITLGEKIRETNKNIIIIYLTSCPGFMRQAFSIHAFEYITKPYTKERIFKVLDDVISISPDMSRYIDIVCGRKKIRIEVNDIMSVVSDAHYLKISTCDNSVYRTRMTVSEFFMLVGNDPKLLQINKGIIVNIDYIKSTDNALCLMFNGQTFPIKVREKSKIETKIREYIFEKNEKQSIKRKRKYGINRFF